MALIIKQKPLYNILPVGQPVIYTVFDSTVVSSKFKVKYIAEVHISSTTPPNTSTGTPVGTFKTTPNNAGVGIFDLSKVVESYVNSDNNSAEDSLYKGNQLTNIETDYRPLQTTDKFSMTNNSVRWLAIVFKIEGAATATGVPSIQDTENSQVYLLFNGYLKRTDVLDKSTTNADFGFDTTDFVLSSNASKFLTNAPNTQYAEVGDYGTLSFLRTDGTLDNVLFTFTDQSGSTTTETFKPTQANGGSAYNTEAERNLLHLGAFPANLRNWSSTFQTLITNDNLDFYTVVLRNAANSAISETITIYRQCPDLKGYEAIRLCWLNQYGVWDYYTFTKRSNRSITTQGTQYNQIEGTWNESYYQVNGYKGGKKSFRVNAMERLTINTDYVNEAEGVWFEELINSPEVYIVNGFSDIVDTNTTLSTYVEPVRLTTSSYTRKTIANDKLMQYTFELEKSKILRTQAV